MGKLHWGTDPVDENETPNPQIRVEIDYQADNTGPLQNASWRESIENNYAMYGINVTFLPDRQTQVIDFDSPPYLYRDVGITNASLPSVPRVDDPFTEEELYAIRDAYSDSSAGTNGDVSLYFFVANSTQDPSHRLLSLTQTGVRWNGPDDPTGYNRDDSEWVAIFRNGHYTGNVPSRLSLTQNESVRAVAHKTAVHELGHVLNMGENEPAERIDGDEVYSGSKGDPTIELVTDRSRSQDVDEWSVMSEGAEEDQYLPPTEDTYFAFSIEELSTVSTVDTQVASP